MCKCWECKEILFFFFLQAPFMPNTLFLSPSLFKPGLSLSPSPIFISSHLPIPCCYSLFLPYSTPASLADSSFPPPSQSHLFKVHRGGVKSVRTLCCDTKVCFFCQITARRNKKKKWIKMIHEECPLLTGCSVNDMPVIPVHVAGSCYRNVSPISSTCSCYRDSTSCGVSYR